MTNERAKEVAADLIGTCRELSDFATEEEMNNVEFCEDLDDLVFQCDECGWWFGVKDMSNRGYACMECLPDEEPSTADDIDPQG